jgi:hypothetical protein
MDRTSPPTAQRRPSLAVVAQNFEPKRHPSFFARPRQFLLSKTRAPPQAVMLSMAETTWVLGMPTPANAAPIISSCAGSISAFRGPLTPSKNQPNRPCRQTRQAAGFSASCQRYTAQLPASISLRKSRRQLRHALARQAKSSTRSSRRARPTVGGGIICGRGKLSTQN